MKNVFIRDGRKHIVFTDSKGRLMGEYLKQLEYRRPELIKILRAELSKRKTFSLYDIIDTKEVAFFIVKNDYRNKLNEELVKNKIVDFLNLEINKDLSFKTYLKDLKIELEHSKLAVYDRCDWVVGEKYEKL